jgi:2-C-methyl-D-erythritol 2,4-cyclodiphosphate synthase
MRVGFGYDVHRLVKDRALILGGVDIPFRTGLLGHSDADVLIHAVIDALLGAAALGDIGAHFPPSDPKYKDISSIKLLCHVSTLLKEKGYGISNIDSTVVAEAPKLALYISVMVENIAGALGCAPGLVSVKATTEEGMGVTGSGEAISAYAVTLLSSLETETPEKRKG